MKKAILILILFFSISSFAQVKGTVTDSKGKPIAFANIYVKDTYISTTSNEQGKYELNIKIPGTYVILYKYLGYKTEKKVVEFDKLALLVDATLQEEEIQLQDVAISNKVNPAIEIIKNAIAGFYYFKKSSYFIDSAYKVILDNASFDNKYFTSSVFNQMILDNYKIGYYLIPTNAYFSFYTPDKIKEF